MTEVYVYTETPQAVIFVILDLDTYCGSVNPS